MPCRILQKALRGGPGITFPQQPITNAVPVKGTNGHSQIRFPGPNRGAVERMLSPGMVEEGTTPE